MISQVYDTIDKVLGYHIYDIVYDILSYNMILQCQNNHIIWCHSYCRGYIRYGNCKDVFLGLPAATAACELIAQLSGKRQRFACKLNSNDSYTQASEGLLKFNLEGT